MRRTIATTFLGLGLLLSGCATESPENTTASTASAGGTTPPPTPAASPFNTTEFQANWALDSIGALTAYDDGLSGAGVVVGVIDTGVDIDQTDLDDNIHSASKDIYDGAINVLETRAGSTTNFSDMRGLGVSLDDVMGHGTFVAGLIAAEKNNQNSHGLAFNAQVLAVRTDEPGTCPASCTFDDNALAAAINHAVANGADVINLSLGGSAANPYLEGALEDAVLADVVLVVSAGNAPESTAPYSPSNDPDPMALEAVNTWMNGQMIIAGAANTSGTIADFGNRAGTGANFFLMAPGMDLYGPTVNPNNGASTHGIGSGTSFAAPIISAAAALLKEKFPALTAAEIVEIMLDTATDVGAPGVDAITGHGLLNLDAALAPIGTSSIILSIGNGSVTTSDHNASLLSGGAFGDGVVLGLSGGSIFLDDYDRAYETEFSQQMRLAPGQQLFEDRLEGFRDFETASLDLSPGVTMTMSARYADPYSTYEDAVLGLTDQGERRSEGFRFKLQNQVDERTRVSLGFGNDVEDMLGASVAGKGFGGQSFLSEGIKTPWQSTENSGRQFGVERAFGPNISLSFGFGRDDVEVPEVLGLARFSQGAARTSVVSRFGYASEQGGVDLTLGQIQEEGLVLGSFSSGYLGLGSGADTSYLSLAANKTLGSVGGHRLSAFGRVTGGSSDIHTSAGSVFSSFERLSTSQFALGLSFDGVFSPSGRLSLAFSQPLRLEGGAARLATASGWNYESETPIFAHGPKSLAPSGRELDLELGYAFNLKGAQVSANVLYQKEPGHIAGSDDGIGFMLTSRSRF